MHALNNNAGVKANSEEPIKRIVREQRALAILRLMNGEIGQWTNNEVLAPCLASIGLCVSYRELEEDLDTLERLSLLKLERKPSGLIVANLTRRGSEVAEGVSDAEGVARPGPECPY